MLNILPSVLTPFVLHIFKLNSSTLSLKLSFVKSKLGHYEIFLIKNLTKENPLGQNFDEGKRVKTS